MNTIITPLDRVIGQKLNRASIGLLSHEEKLGIVDIDCDGLDGEVLFKFDPEGKLFVSWGSKPHVPKETFCTQVSNTSFHNGKIIFIPAPINSDLSKAEGKVFTQYFIFGARNDPLVLHLVFENNVVRIGTFDYNDTTYVRKLEVGKAGEESNYELLWASESHA